MRILSNVLCEEKLQSQNISMNSKIGNKLQKFERTKKKVRIYMDHGIKSRIHLKQSTLSVPDGMSPREMAGRPEPIFLQHLGRVSTRYLPDLLVTSCNQAAVSN
jgi:hypothetical protein